MSLRSKYWGFQMPRLIFPVVLVIFLLTLACDAVSTDSITDAVKFENEVTEPNSSSAQSGNTARVSSRCDGLSIIAEVEAAGRANPYRAMQEYDDVENMRGCLEGTIVGYPMGQIMPGQPIADQAIGITIDVLVEEDRGFTLGYTVPEPPEPPDALREGMPEDLTPAQEVGWWARHDAAEEEYQRARDATNEEEVRSAERWKEFALSASVGDRVRANCLLFVVSVSDHYDTFDEGVEKHLFCKWIEK